MSYRKILFIIKTAFRVTNVVTVAFFALLIFNFWIAMSVFVNVLYPISYIFEVFYEYEFVIFILSYLYIYIISILICIISFYIKVFLKLSKVEFYIVVCFLNVIYIFYILFML